MFRTEASERQGRHPSDIEVMKSSDLLTTNQETINYQEVSSPYNAMPLNNNKLSSRVKEDSFRTLK